MALTATERTNIVKLTVALYNAAPGASGLSDFTTFYEANGRDLNVLATNLTNNILFKSLYPNFLTVGDFATAILSNYGLQANTDAIAFITSRFNAGMNKGQIAYEAAIAINNTSAATGDFANARAILNNKTLVAENYSVALSGQSVNIGVLQGVIAGVTADPATVTAANNTNANLLGQIFTLTTGVDTLVGTGGNDTFTADNSNTAKQLTAADSINGGAGNDTLRLFSAAGTATNVSGSAATVTASALDSLGTLTSIENIFVNGANYGGLNFNVSGITGVTSLQMDSISEFGTAAAGTANGVGTTTTLTVASGTAVTLSNLTPTVLAGVNNAANAYNNAAEVFTTTIAGAATITSQSVTVNRISSATHVGQDGNTYTDTNTVNLSGTGVATLNLTSTGAASTLTLTDSGAALANIIIGTSGSADAALTMTVGSGAAFAANGIASINAAADTAATTITTVAGTNLATSFAYTGGTANDSLDLTNAQIGGVNVSAAQLNVQTFNGGLGTNTLILNNAIVTGAVALTSLTNEQIIGDSAANGTVNFTNFGAATGFAFTGALAGAVTINNLASAATLTYATSTIAGNAVVVNAIGSGTADTLALTFGSATAVVGAATAGGNTTINGYETVNLIAQGAAGGTDALQALTIGASAGGAETLNITATRGLSVTTLALSGSSTAINLSGAGAFTSTGAVTSGTFTSTGTGALTIATGSNILAFNSGTVNANTSILDTAATSAASITTGNGTNTITASGFNDVIRTGTGANTITGGAGADSITVGVHNGTTVIDSFVQTAAGSSGLYAAPGANTISTAAFDVINGSVKGDTVNVAAVAHTVTSSNTLVGASPLDNTAIMIRGTYTASTNTFVGTVAGADTLLAYDNDASGAVALEAIVLVGYVNVGTATSSAGGLFTLA